MNNKIIKEEAKRSLVEDKNIWILYDVLLFVVYLAFAAFSYVYALSLLLIPLFVGVYLVTKDVLARKQVDFYRLISGYRNLNHAIISSVVWLINCILISLGFFLLIVPGIYLFLRFGYAYYIILDEPEITITEAFNKASKMMEGHKMELFYLCLSFIGHFLLTAITFGIYGVYAIPYFNLSYTNYYLKLRDLH